MKFKIIFIFKKKKNFKKLSNKIFNKFFVFLTNFFKKKLDY